jgi:hypothetical protein
MASAKVTNIDMKKIVIARVRTIHLGAAGSETSVHLTQTTSKMIRAANPRSEKGKRKYFIDSVLASKPSEMTADFQKIAQQNANIVEFFLAFTTS